MVERILQLHFELAPDTFDAALEQTKRAAALEDEETKKTRELDNAKEVQKVFDAIKTNDANTALAIAHFKAWVKNQKPLVMTDGRYHLNLLHLLYCAFDILARQGGTLTGGWYSALGDKFCFEIIGGAIESELSPRLQKILISELYALLYCNKPAPRAIDLHSTLFNSPKPWFYFTPLQLGVNSYYSTRGHWGQGFVNRRSSRRTGWKDFSNLLQQLHQPFRLMPHQDPQAKASCLIL